MAHSIIFDPKTQKKKEEDEEWLASLALIREITRAEQQAEEDRLFAARLAEMIVEPVPDEQRRMAMYLNDLDDDDEEQEEEKPGTVNNSIIKKSTSTRSTPKKCASCLEIMKKNEIQVPCGHYYHSDCLKELFLASMKDETLMPPRCCAKEIPLNLIILSPNEKEQFLAKHLEYTTVNRLYCHRPTCSEFIPPKLIQNNIGTCPKLTCGSKTCSLCKGAFHQNNDCPKDTETKAVLEVAKDEGWSRCYQCRSLVELTHGCYHMTCRCRAEFCYLCSKPWKNCGCAQWDENRLLDEARDRVIRIQSGQPRRNQNLFNFNEQIRLVTDQLRANVECRHGGRWIYTPGAGNCQECHHFLPQYLFRCASCHLMACNRCRRNRF